VARTSRLPLRRLVLVGIAAALAIGIGIGLLPKSIDADRANRIAERLLAGYQNGSGESGRHFGTRETRAWADGWEVRWRYRPCAEFASLRVWVSRDGRRARFAELPDCAPMRGYAGVPRVA